MLEFVSLDDLLLGEVSIRRKLSKMDCFDSFYAALNIGIECSIFVFRFFWLQPRVISSSHLFADFLVFFPQAVYLFDLFRPMSA